MPKRGEAWPHALKVRSTTSGAHSAKADATSAGANSTCGDSATAECAAVEATTAGVTAATKSTTTAESSTSAAVPSRPCYGTERHSRDADYQNSYLFYFHAFKFGLALLASDCAPVGFYGAT
jgi:hypothetical protein